MVEDVERLETELEGSFLFDGEMLEQCHIEVGPIRIAQEVPPDVSEGESSGHAERSGIVKEARIAAHCDRAWWRDIGVGVAN